LNPIHTPEKKTRNHLKRKLLRLDLLLLFKLSSSPTQLDFLGPSFSLEKQDKILTISTMTYFSNL